jgi:hypothetical protein
LQVNPDKFLSVWHDQVAAVRKEKDHVGLWRIGQRDEPFELRPMVPGQLRLLVKPGHALGRRKQQRFIQKRRKNLPVARGDLHLYLSIMRWTYRRDVNLGVTGALGIA